MSGSLPPGVPPGVSGVRLGSAPAVSVIVVCGSAPEHARRLLPELAPQCAREGAELLVVGFQGPEALEALRARFPAARFVAAPEGTPAARLRGLGMIAATGDIVAIVDDHRILPRDWLEQLIRSRDPAVPIEVS